MAVVKLFADLLKEAAAREAMIQVGEHQIPREVFEANVEVLKKLMSTDGSSQALPKISMREALGTPDASILFPKVINDVLVRPIEPNMLASTRLAKTISIDGSARSVVFPTIGAIRAAEIGETQDYPQVHPGFTELTTEVKVSKFGVMIPVSEDVINDSMWDVLALFVEAGGFAMARIKEERCFKELSESSHVVFDNSGTDPDGLTTGMDVSGKANGTLSFNDLVDAIGVLISNEYTPTDITLHPMIWSVFVKDPLIQFQMMQSGSLGQMFTGLGPDGIEGKAPFGGGFTFNVTPFVPYNTSKTITLGGVSRVAPTTNIFITDRNNSLVILTKEPLSTEDFADPYRDIRFVKIREKYGVGVLNAGKASVVLKDIMIARNYEPAYTIRTMA